MKMPTLNGDPKPQSAANQTENDAQHLMILFLLNLLWQLNNAARISVSIH